MKPTAAINDITGGPEIIQSHPAHAPHTGQTGQLGQIRQIKPSAVIQSQAKRGNWIDDWIDGFVHRTRKKLRRWFARGLEFPHVDFGSYQFHPEDDPAHCAPEMDWNDEFIAYLKYYGYGTRDNGDGGRVQVALTDEEVVNDWLMELYRNAVYEEDLKEKGVRENPMEPHMGREQGARARLEGWQDQEYDPLDPAQFNKRHGVRDTSTGKNGNEEMVDGNEGLDGEHEGAGFSMADRLKGAWGRGLGRGKGRQRYKAYAVDAFDPDDPAMWYGEDITEEDIMEYMNTEGSFDEWSRQGRPQSTPGWQQANKKRGPVVPKHEKARK